jgi:hypothetical protein
MAFTVQHPSIVVVIGYLGQIFHLGRHACLSKSKPDAAQLISEKKALSQRLISKSLLISAARLHHLSFHIILRASCYQLLV